MNDYIDLETFPEQLFQFFSRLSKPQLTRLQQGPNSIVAYTCVDKRRFNFRIFYGQNKKGMLFFDQMCSCNLPIVPELNVQDSRNFLVSGLDVCVRDFIHDLDERMFYYFIRSHFHETTMTIVLNSGEGFGQLS
jgi:hypothetical protein